MTTVVKRILLCVALPTPGFLRKGRQIFSHSRLERCYDHSRVSVTGAQHALRLSMAAQSREPSPI